VGPPKLALRKSIAVAGLSGSSYRETKTFVRLSMTPADSRYLRNASFFCSVACGGYAREGSEGQSRRFGANETARNREPEDAARERRRETSGEKPPAKRRVEDMARSTLMHFPTLTDRRSGLDAGRDARARGHERVSSETRPSRMAHARRRSGEHARELRARPRARCRSRSETASRSVERFRAHEGSAVDAAASPNATEGDGPRVSYHID
jgi:hypothetical protein